LIDSSQYTGTGYSAGSQFSATEDQYLASTVTPLGYSSSSSSTGKTALQGASGRKGVGRGSRIPSGTSNAGRVTTGHTEDVYSPAKYNSTAMVKERITAPVVETGSTAGRFCVDCGTQFPTTTARFCGECGAKR